MPNPRQAKAPRPPGKCPDRASLHEAALRHLARFAATEAGLLRVLDRRILRWQHATESAPEVIVPARAAAREVVQALTASGMLDDANFAAARSRRLVRAGRSRVAVSAHLAAKGVDAETAGTVLPDAEAEFLAAVAFVRRRRIGPFRTPDAEEGDGNREMGMLARAGFPREVAARALRLDPEAAVDLLAELKRG